MGCGSSHVEAPGTELPPPLYGQDVRIEFKKRSAVRSGGYNIYDYKPIPLTINVPESGNTPATTFGMKFGDMKGKPRHPEYNGAIVVSSPSKVAKAAGFIKDDIVHAIAGTKPNSVEHATALLENAPVGSTVELIRLHHTKTMLMDGEPNGVDTSALYSNDADADGQRFDPVPQASGNGE